MASPPHTSVDEFLRLRALHWPDAHTPITQLMVRLFRLSDRVVAVSTAEVGRLGLSFTEFEVLAALRGAAPPHELQPTQLYAAILISSGGLTKVLHGLEANGLVSRKADDADRRSRPVRLTAKGRSLAERAMMAVLNADRKRVARQLSRNEVETLTRLLGKLSTAWETDDERP